MKTLSSNNLDSENLEQITTSDKEALADLGEVEKILLAGLNSTVGVTNDLSNRLIRSGGKRIRPYLLCLAYRSLKTEAAHLDPRGSAKDLHTLAAVAEWVHTATLFHDDVLDSSPLRRNETAAHVLAGNRSAILCGDFVYAEAFSLLMQRGLLAPSQKLASTIKSVVEGELLQYQNCKSRSLDSLEYDRIARSKTGALFAWCTETGTWLAGSPDYEAAARFGLALGFAFQMADDLLDTFEVNPDNAPESELDQWLESAAPLPIIIAAQLQHGLEIQELWNGAADTTLQSPAIRSNRVRELQSYCRQAPVVRACLDRVADELGRASIDLQKTGASRGLRWSLQAIWDRAVRGAVLSGTFTHEEIKQPKGI